MRAAGPAVATIPGPNPGGDGRFPTPHDARRPRRDRPPRIAVTLSEVLLARLRAEADALGLPLEYLVAALVADTIEPARPIRAGRAA